MMSKLIVEMPMPTRCGACKCRHVEFDIDRVAVFCAIKDNEYVEDPDSRPSWCPIKGVLPDEHGRLIDEAVFCENVVKYSHQSTKTIGKALDATPTIIEMTLIDTERSET